MAQTIADIVNALPKPATLEEQYMYKLVCATAGVTPKYGIAEDKAFRRMEQYWHAFSLATTKKFSDLEYPGENTVSTKAVQNGAITIDKLDAGVKARLWGESRNGEVTEAMLNTAVKNRLWSTTRSKEVTIAMLADAVVARLWGANRTGEVTEVMLADEVRRKLGGGATLYRVTMPTLSHQTFTVSVDVVARTDHNTFYAEEDSVITFTDPVADTGYEPGTLTVTGGTAVTGETNKYTLTSDMTFSITAATGGTTYHVTMPTLTHQTFTVSVDGTARSNTNSFDADENSVITFTDPVADTGYTPGTITVTGGTAVSGQTNTYTLTSDMTFSITAASQDTPTPSGSYDITALRDGESLLMTDNIITLNNSATSDWQTKIDVSELNTAIGLNNTVKIEYAVFVPTGNGCAFGPEFVIYTNGTSTTQRFSATANTMHSTSYSNGTLYTAVVQYTVNDVEETLMRYYKQYGANSGSGEIKVRLRASNLTQSMTADVTSQTLYVD